jgi:hypothetical protein
MSHIFIREIVLYHQPRSFNNIPPRKENGMDPVRVEYFAKLGPHIIEQLKQRRLDGVYVATREEAVSHVRSMIPEGSSVYRAGSVTLMELGLIDIIYSIPGVTVFDPYRSGLSPEESMEQRRNGLLADLMITSFNAITRDGRIVNLDGMGNRVAGMAFGPKKVILVAGMNKVVCDVDEAMKRVKFHAAPLNVIRLGIRNPCLETGVCADCKSPGRICNMWSVIEGHMIKDRIHVVLVGETLGY